MTILLYNIRRAHADKSDFWILIDNEIIKDCGYGSPYPTNINIAVDGGGAYAMPGVIDCHVHFREPGLTQKADIATESQAAAIGGVTSYLEMPNTKPATTTIEAWNEKMDRAATESSINYGFFIGATNDNIEQLKAADYTKVPGVKMFMGSSTGNMLVDNEETISKVMRDVKAIVAVHAEDQTIIDHNTQKAIQQYGSKEAVPLKCHSQIRSCEACYSSTAKAVALAKKYNHRLHICHITTAAELSLLEKGDPATKLITSEVSPHHLMWCDKDYATKGTRIKMNPAVKSEHDRHDLLTAVDEGLIDIVATDHAPHLLAEKEGGALTAASGAPLIQYSLLWMLDNFDKQTVERVMCTNPAKVYHIDRRGSLQSGYYADITLVKEVEPYEVTDADVVSKCGWTPLQGLRLSHKVTQTWVNGNCVCAGGEIQCTDAAMPLRFNPDSQDADK